MNGSDVILRLVVEKQHFAKIFKEKIKKKSVSFAIQKKTITFVSDFFHELWPLKTV